MTITHALLLGILQGLTEFLPVSSSGHLVLTELLLGLHIAPENMQGLNVLLHAGTLLALLLVYSKTWWNLLCCPLSKNPAHTRKLVLLLIATIPGAASGFFLENWIAQNFQTQTTVGLAFSVTALVLLLGESCHGQNQTVWHRLLHPFEKEPRKLTTRSALFIGVAQACALVPGLSRSGLTISAGRMIGLEREEALEFSFLMAVPILLGASSLTVIDVMSGDVVLPSMTIVLIAVVAAFVASLSAVLFLRRFVVRRSLAWFAPYLLVLSGITLLL